MLRCDLSAFYAMGSIVRNSSHDGTVFCLCFMPWTRLRSDSTGCRTQARLLCSALVCGLVLDHGTPRPGGWPALQGLGQQSASKAISHCCPPLPDAENFFLAKEIPHFGDAGDIFLVPAMPPTRTSVPSAITVSLNPQQIDDCAAPAQ